MPNQLKYARSPYLKQHENNPVHWHEWGSEALNLAQKEDKLILVSIGYSACHWCHVMAHESFEDQETAEIMNTHFVNIKIDREERPDLDAIYMDACQLVTGSGGWPLNAFALPDGTPFHAGTYFPKPQWQKVLLQIAQLWQQDRSKVLDFAKDLKDGIETVSGFIPEQEKEPTGIETALEKLSSQFDSTYGGMKRAPKFPMPTLWNFLIDPILGSEGMQKHSLLTLEQMSLGGIYDWVEGGFARYSVDERWFAPHFEKMLYDNAQLINLYCRAYAISGDANLLQIAEDSADYVVREWKANDGGFYSAYDADSEGVEGKYYCLTWTEIEELDVSNKNLFTSYFQLKENGNWEHGLNILYPIYNQSVFALQNDVSNFSDQLKSWKNALREVRSKKIKPGLDDKQNTAWNALLLTSFCHLYSINPIEKWKKEASSLHQYLIQGPIGTDGKLTHMVQNQEPYIQAFLEDYALNIAALISYFETFSDAEALQQAAALSAETITHFYDKQSGFFKNSREQQIVKHKIEITDNVIPSSNSTMCENLLKLGLILGKEEWMQMGEKMLDAMESKAREHPQHYSNWCRILLIRKSGYSHIISNAPLPKGHLYKTWMHLAWTPEMSNISVFEHKNFEKIDTFYYCANKVCHAPVYNAEEIQYM